MRRRAYSSGHGVVQRGAGSRRAAARSPASAVPAATMPESSPACTETTRSVSSWPTWSSHSSTSSHDLGRHVGAEPVVGDLDRPPGAVRHPALERDVRRAGGDVDVVLGQRKWYCDCFTSPTGTKGTLPLPLSAEARIGPIWLENVGEIDERVRVRVDVDHLAEAGMGGGAVVALEVVLERDLPVGVDRPLVVRVEARASRGRGRCARRSPAARRASRRAAPRPGRG